MDSLCQEKISIYFQNDMITIDCISTFNFVSRVNNFLSHWKILEQIGSKIEFCNHLLSSPLRPTARMQLEILSWNGNENQNIYHCNHRHISLQLYNRPPKKENLNLKMDFCNHNFDAPLPPLQVGTCKDWLYNLLTSREESFCGENGKIWKFAVISWLGVQIES